LSERPLAARWAAVRAERRAALIPFLTAGFPSRNVSRDALRRAATEGADILEVGVPFSDPLADGPVIQRATQTALEQGMTMARVLDLVRDAAVAVPVVLMTYLNPVLAYGADRFLADAHAAGVAGVLLTDLPAGADPALEHTVAGSGLDFIRLIAPTTSDARMRDAVQGGGGFVYLISRLGVTGARDDVPGDLGAQVARVRAATTLPIVVGFGIGAPAQARAAARVADGVVVGSALVAALAEGGVDALGRQVRALASAVREARA
jgi:tryptophan synthase alpha chain